jgi:hypothetical protein
LEGSEKKNFCERERMRERMCVCEREEEGERTNGKMEANEEFILEKWKDTKYRGAFSGITNLQRMLNEDFNLSLTRKNVLDALRKEPAFLSMLNDKSNYPTRSFGIDLAFDTWVCDVSDMPKYGHYKGFLIIVDAGSRKIFTKALTNKRAETLRTKFTEVIKKECENFSPETIVTDDGAEFKGNMSVFYREHVIRHKVIRSKAKAALAERYIGIVKERLFKGMEALSDKNWVKLLPDITQAVNDTQNPSNGGLKPSDIKTPWDNIKLEEVKKNRPYQQPNWYDQRIAQRRYEENAKNIKVGDLVLSHTGKKSMFRKGYQRKVRIFW